MSADVFPPVHIESSEVIELQKRMYKSMIIALCMLLLILDTKTAINGAAEGVELSIRVLIPSLLPFFLVSVLLTDMLSGPSTITRPIGALLKIPQGSESLFIIGMLGGYPVGAQVVCQATKNEILDKRDAARMMAFCNNAGPAFLFGVISTQFPSHIYTWFIWAILILSTILTAVILPGGNTDKITIHATKHITITQAMEKSVKTLSGVCAWVIIFRVILAFVERWFLWILPSAFQIAVQMLLELANGSIVLNEIGNIGVRFLVTTVGLSLGGFCVLLQTMSVSSTVGIGKYIPGKLIQTCISIILSIPMVFILNTGISPLYMVAILLCFVPAIVILSNFRKKRQNKYSIPLPGSV